MNRQGSGPGRGTFGRPGDAAAARDAYQRDSYLEAGAYPVDPGYQAYAGGRERDRPRPADQPPGPARPRPERGAPPRQSSPSRGGRQAAQDPGSADRPWQRPEDAMPEWAVPARVPRDRVLGRRPLVSSVPVPREARAMPGTTTPRASRRGHIRHRGRGRGRDRDRDGGPRRQAIRVRGTVLAGRTPRPRPDGPAPSGYQPGQQWAGAGRARQPGLCRKDQAAVRAARDRVPRRAACPVRVRDRVRRIPRILNQ